MSKSGNSTTDNISPKKINTAECKAYISKDEEKLNNEMEACIQAKAIFEEQNLSYSTLCGRPVQKRNSMCHISEKMKSYLLGMNHRRQSLPLDIKNVLTPPMMNFGGHLSPAYEVNSCPGSPRRYSFVSTNVTPTASISSFVSSLDRSFSEQNLLDEDDNNDGNALICYEIEKYLESLEDADYLNSFTARSPLPTKEKPEEINNASKRPSLSQSKDFKL